MRCCWCWCWCGACCVVAVRLVACCLPVVAVLLLLLPAPPACGFFGRVRASWAGCLPAGAACCLLLPACCLPAACWCAVVAPPLLPYFFWILIGSDPEDTDFCRVRTSFCFWSFLYVRAVPVRYAIAISKIKGKWPRFLVEMPSGLCGTWCLHECTAYFFCFWPWGAFFIVSCSTVRP